MAIIKKEARGEYTLLLLKHLQLTVILTLSKLEINICGVPYDTINDYLQQTLINNMLVNLCLPGLASDKNLAGVHDTAGQTSGVNGTQGRTELDDVSPDKRFREQTCMLPRRWRFMLTCMQTHVLSHKQSEELDRTSEINFTKK